jgi:hypothetical protein
MSAPAFHTIPQKQETARMDTGLVTRYHGEVAESVRGVAKWMQERDFAGFDLYDMLNSPYLSSWASTRFPFNALCVQVGKRWAGAGARKMMRVPASKNPKALGLALAGFCDLARCGERTESQAQYLKSELKRLSSPGEPYFCWGYDWNYATLRSIPLTAFGPNCIATYFCASALLDMHEVFGDGEARKMAESAGKFIVQRLNRSVDTPRHLCFSYTPEDHTKIVNNSVLAGSLLARLAYVGGDAYIGFAKRTLQYLVDRQRPDGSWIYGEWRWQKWVDSFHTAYNLMALLAYRNATGDPGFDAQLWRGYEFYFGAFFGPDGMPKYSPRSPYPLDIHSCAQAMLTFCAFADSDALRRAVQVFEWTNRNMRNADGSYAFQKHRLWINRTPYMRWGQAWMFHALARLNRRLLNPQGLLMAASAGSL